MKLITPALAAHFGLEQATLAVCWKIEKRDGTSILGTDHDEDVEIPSESPASNLEGVYLAASNITGSDVRNTADSSVDNMEATGALPTETQTTVDVTVADIEAGLLDQAPVTLFVVNWRVPGDGMLIVRHGTLGEIRRDSDGKYTVELRGLKQALQQVFIRTFSERCQVKRFGDTECKFDLASVLVSGSVTSVSNAKEFVASVGGSPTSAAGFFNGGELTFTSGANAGYMREVKRDDNGSLAGHFLFWERFPNDPAPGDTFDLTPGCDRLIRTCKDKYANVVNFRGYGVFIQGADSLLKGPI